MKTFIRTALQNSVSRIFSQSLLALSLLGASTVTPVSGQTIKKSTVTTKLTQITVPPLTPSVDFSPAARASRPTLVVFIHGGTSRPGAEPQPFEPRGALKRPGTLGYSRFYFDFPFVSRTLGASTALFTMTGGAGSRLTAAGWKDSLLANIRANQFAFPTDPAPLRGRFTGTAGALVRLNGSIAIGLMAKQALDEIRVLRTEFEAYAGREAYIVLVGHSKGGLVTRYLLSVPTGNVAGHDLSAADETFLRSLRDDVKFGITIGSPHTGSPLADYGDDFRRGIQSTQTMVNAVWSATRAAASVVRVNLSANPPFNLETAAQMYIGSEDDLGHLTTEFWNTMNNGPLHPRLMVRSDASRIPLYLYGGRAAGDVFYGTQRFDIGGGPSADALANENNPTHVGTLMTMGLIGLDYALHNVVDGDWGHIRTAGASNKNLDIVRRAYPVFGLPRNRMSNPGERMFLIGKEGMPTYYLRNQADRETDSDGMVSIDSALGIGLFTGPVTIEAFQAINIPIPQVMMEPWERNQSTAASGQAFVGGAWYRMYSGAWNFQNHSTLTKRAELGVELRRVLMGAGPKASRTGNLSVW